MATENSSHFLYHILIHIFYLSGGPMSHIMKDTLQIEETQRMKDLVHIKDAFLGGHLSLEEARKELLDKVGSCEPHEFAYGEQKLKGSYTDEEISHRMDDLLTLFDGILVRTKNDYPTHHPLWVYVEEIKSLQIRLETMSQLLQEKHFILNPWLAIYEDLSSWTTHIARKQNQLYPLLEKHGFDRPTKIMWTFDDKVRSLIKSSKTLLLAREEEQFLSLQKEVIDTLEDLNNKEMEVLFPTAWKLLSEEEYIHMSRGDHEIGFSLISPPPYYKNTEVAPHNLMADLVTLLEKYNLTSNSTDLDVATGKLSLERINLLFKHLPVDLSYVDEDNIVKFYSDTPNRIFPRSANVIGRDVRNCHPSKSLHVVEEIIRKFKSGEESRAEFWINKPDLFIYVVYVAVRDEKGCFKGVLEMMQDCTHIRALTGSRTLLTWDGCTAEDKEDSQQAFPPSKEEETSMTPSAIPPLTGDTKLFPLFELFPGLKEHMVTIHPLLQALHTPLANLMREKATLEMVSHRIHMPLEELINKIETFLKK